MSPSRSSSPSLAIADEPTPKPASAVSPITPAGPPPESSRRTTERRAALLDYFANPPPAMSEMDAAWEEALVLYGDEDSDAWVTALEDGSHPLCRVGEPLRPA